MSSDSAENKNKLTDFYCSTFGSTPAVIETHLRCTYTCWEIVCSTGFVRNIIKLHRSDIVLQVTSQLKSVDLSHENETVTIVTTKFTVVWDVARVRG